MQQECNIWHHPGINSACLHQSCTCFFTWKCCDFPFSPLPGSGRDFPFMHYQLSTTVSVCGSSAPDVNLLPWFASGSMFGQLGPRAELQSCPSHQPSPEMWCHRSFHRARNMGQPLQRYGLLLILRRSEEVSHFLFRV